LLLKLLLPLSHHQLNQFINPLSNPRRLSHQLHRKQLLKPHLLKPHPCINLQSNSQLPSNTFNSNNNNPLSRSNPSRNSSSNQFNSRLSKLSNTISSKHNNISSNHKRHCSLPHKLHRLQFTQRSAPTECHQASILPNLMCLLGKHKCPLECTQVTWAQLHTVTTHPTTASHTALQLKPNALPPMLQEASHTIPSSKCLNPMHLLPLDNVVLNQFILST
jgi:hypothetical protein